MITIDDLMMSCGGVPVPGGDGGRQTVATGDQHHQLTVSRIRTAVSMLNRRTGHARFRLGPPVADAEQRASSSDQQPPPPGFVKACEAGFSTSASGGSSSLPSTTVTSLTAGEGSVSNDRALGCYLFQPVSGGSYTAARPLPPAISVQQQRASSPGYSPGTATKNGKCHGRARSENDAGGMTHGGRCHCSKKRKARVKRMVRVPAISSRNADIPPDDYSWRKYGQKPIKGSPYPRGYYKCSTVRGCPARKHVERDPGEPAMLIVTYEGDHRHEDQQERGGRRRGEDDGAPDDVQLNFRASLRHGPQAASLIFLLPSCRNFFEPCL